MDQAGGRPLFISVAEEREARKKRNFKEGPLVQCDLISYFTSLAHIQKAYRKIILTNHFTGNEKLKLQQKTL